MIVILLFIVFEVGDRVILNGLLTDFMGAVYNFRLRLLDNLNLLLLDLKMRRLLLNMYLVVRVLD